MDAVGLSPATIQGSLDDLLTTTGPPPIKSSETPPGLGKAQEGGSAIPAFGEVLSGFLSPGRRRPASLRRDG